MMKFFKSMFTRGGSERGKDDDSLIELQTVKGLFDPLDRPLTDEEKNSPMTFFGVPYQVRKERIEQAAARETAMAVDRQAADGVEPTTRPNRIDWAAEYAPAADAKPDAPMPNPQPRMKQ